jgi:hypothetical protein
MKHRKHYIITFLAYKLHTLLVSQQREEGYLEALLFSSLLAGA